MKKYLDKLANLPLAHRITLGVFLLLLSVGLFWQFVYTDLSLKLSDLTVEIENLETKILQEKKISKNLEKFQAESKEQDELLANVLRELPDQKEIETFLRSISVLATDTGLEVLEFTPLPEKKKGYLAELPVSMKLEGTFHQLITFFDEVAHLPRIVNIDQIDISLLSETPEDVILRFTCRATTFRYLEDADRGPKGEAGEQQRRRRR